jgi:hypothetical protein
VLSIGTNEERLGGETVTGVEGGKRYMRKGRRLGRDVGCLLLAAVLAGCAPVSAPPQSGGCGRACIATPATASAVCASVSCAAHAIQVFVEPDAGEAPILSAISGARVSIWAEVCAPGNG